MQSSTSEYHKSFTGCVVGRDGTRRWFINGAYGRTDDLPCVEYTNGDKHWYVENPKRGGFAQRSAVEHRENGPSIIRSNGDKYWYQFGDLHRGDDLPAVELADGTRKWFVNGKFIKQERAATSGV